MLFWTLSGLTLLLTVLTFLPLWRHEAWWVRGGEFPRLQFAIAAVILAAIAALVLDLSRPGSWIVIAASLVCLFYQSVDTSLHAALSERGEGRRSRRSR